VEISSSDQRVIALLLACFLSSLVMLGSGASPPEVPISQILGIEDGTNILVYGLMVDLWGYESGAESFVLAEPESGRTVKVVSSPAASPQPSEYAQVGDELRVSGELSKTGFVPTIFTKSDRVSLTRESEDVLGIEVLGRNWHLFEGDCVRVGGILLMDGLGVGPRLFDLGMRSSLALSMDGFDAASYLGERVIVTGILGFDSRTLSLILTVRGISVET
jgi:hypothetical protein